MFVSGVIHRASCAKQPLGGYISLRAFTKEVFTDDRVVSSKENVPESIIDIATEYLTRLKRGVAIDDVFSISRKGAELIEKSTYRDTITIYNQLLAACKGLDDISIAAACKLSSFNDWVSGASPDKVLRGIAKFNPDSVTEANIRVFVERSVWFWSQVGPIIQDGFAFGSYGEIRYTYDSTGLYLTKDTLWDYAVCKSLPTKESILSLAMGWVMGKEVAPKEFADVKYIGFFNPRSFVSYTLDMESIPSEFIRGLKADIFC